MKGDPVARCQAVTPHKTDEGQYRRCARRTTTSVHGVWLCTHHVGVFAIYRDLYFRDDAGDLYRLRGGESIADQRKGKQ